MRNELSSQPVFDQTLYSNSLARLNAGLSSSLMGFRDADFMIGEMRADEDMFKASVLTPNFQSTLELMEKMAKYKRTSSNSDFIDAIPQFAQPVFGEFQEAVAAEPETYLVPTFKTAKVFADTTSEDLIRLATVFFVDNLDGLIETQDLPDGDVEYAIRHIITAGDEQQIRRLVKASVTAGSPLLRRFTRQVDSILNLSILGNNASLRPKRMAVALDEITGDRSEAVLNAWDDSKGKTKDRLKGTESIYFDNFDVVCKLEKQRPGITKFLIEQYGILSFARYPMDILVDQFDTQGQNDAPYGLFVAARHDYNGVLFSIKDDLDSLHKDAKKQGFGLKIFEAESLDGISSAIKTASEKHGPISYLFIAAHGNLEEMTLGAVNPESKTQDYLNLDNINEFSYPDDAFDSSASIGLISCSAGGKDGIAQAMSTVIRDVEIHSPDFVAFLKKGGIKFNVVDGKPNVKLLFKFMEENRNTTGDLVYALTSTTYGAYNARNPQINEYDIPTRVYKNGELVRDYAN